MATFPDMEWMAAFQQRVNTDPEMAIIGDWFTVPISITFEHIRYILHIQHGRILDIIPSPGLDVRCAFGLQAPVSVWRKFLSPEPEPLYHDFFAMLMRVPEFQLEGDTLVAMQNARALHRMMNIMREMGVKDA